MLKNKGLLEFQVLENLVENDSIVIAFICMPRFRNYLISTNFIIEIKSKDLKLMLSLAFALHLSRGECMSGSQ